MLNAESWILLYLRRVLKVWDSDVGRVEFVIDVDMERYPSELSASWFHERGSVGNRGWGWSNSEPHARVVHAKGWKCQNGRHWLIFRLLSSNYFCLNTIVPEEVWRRSSGHTIYDTQDIRHIEFYKYQVTSAVSFVLRYIWHSLCKTLTFRGMQCFDLRLLWVCGRYQKW